MDNALLILMSVLTLIERASFLYIILNKKLEKPKRSGLVGLVIAMFLITGYTLVCGRNHFGIEIFMILFIHTFFSKTRVETLKVWFLSLVVLVVLESSIDGIMKAYGLYATDKQSVWIMECTIIVIAILWLYYVLIGRKLNKELFQLPSQVSRIFIAIMIVMMLMMSYFSYVLEDVPNVKMVKFGTVMILIGGISICGMLVAVIYFFNGNKIYKMQSEMLENYNEQQREYFAKLLEKEQDTRRFRHDIINHLLVLKDMMEREKIVVAQQYVGELLKDIDDERNKQYDVGNNVVNTILNYYLLPIREICTIEVDGYMSRGIQISQKDLCTIFSNILKNAVEAVQEVDGEKVIMVTIDQGKHFLNIQVRNSSQSEIVWSKDGMPQTSKGDSQNHGLGLQNVKQVVSKYGGKCLLNIENGYFVTEIYLKK